MICRDGVAVVWTKRCICIAAWTMPVEWLGAYLLSQWVNAVGGWGLFNTSHSFQKKRSRRETIKEDNNDSENNLKWVFVQDFKLAILSFLFASQRSIFVLLYLYQIQHQLNLRLNTPFKDFSLLFLKFSYKVLFILLIITLLKFYQNVVFTTQILNHHELINNLFI